MSEHSKAPPSSAPRFVHCNASVALEARYPEQDRSQEALEGDASHWAASATLQSMRQFGQAVPHKAATVAPNGVALTEEMIEAADMFTDYVLEQAGSDALDKLHIEERVFAPAIHAECWGSPDAWFASIGTGAIIHLIDYKYGHRRVEAFENWQLIAYMAGILSRPEFNHVPRHLIECHFAIVQPRNYALPGPIREWVVTADKLAPMWDRLGQAYGLAFSANPICHPGPWCQDCRGRHACDTLSVAASAAMDFASVVTPVDMNETALGTELTMIHRAQQLLEARATGLEEQALALLRHGKRVPGYILGQGQAREKWTPELETVFATGDALGIELRKPTAITPSQARKAGIPKEVVDALSDRPAGAVKLEQVTDDKLKRIFNAS